MFLRNAWYVAAWDHEVGNDRPFGRMLLGEPVVFFRDKAGRVAALEDRCRHRHYPLRKGTLTDAGIECFYHGFTYDSSGKCVRIPGQAGIPENARVKRYPVVERYHWIWVWMGDPALADDTKITDFHWMDDPLWRAKGMVFHVKSSYELIIENLLEFSHLAFVHKTTIGSTAIANKADVKMERDANGVTISRWLLDAPAAPTYAKAGGFEGNVDRWNFVCYTLPSFVRLDIGAIEINRGAKDLKTRPFAAEGKMPGGIELRNLNAITPETARTSHYFWSQAHNFQIDRPEVTDWLAGQTREAFTEDWAVFEAQQESIDLDPDAPRIDANGDAPGIQAIQLLRRKIAEEGGAGSTIKS